MTETDMDRRMTRNPFRDSVTPAQLFGAGFGIRGDLDEMVSRIVGVRDRAYSAIEKRGDEPTIPYLMKAIGDENDVAFKELRALLADRDNFALATSILPQELLVAYLSKNPQLLGSNGRFRIGLETRPDCGNFVYVCPIK